MHTACMYMCVCICVCMHAESHPPAELIWYDKINKCSKVKAELVKHHLTACGSYSKYSFISYKIRIQALISYSVNVWWRKPHIQQIWQITGGSPNLTSKF